MDHKLFILIDKAKTELLKLDNMADFHQVKSNFLGKKGSLTDELKKLKDLSPEERSSLGQVLNEIKDKLVNLFDSKESEIKLAILQKKLNEESIDISLPGRGQSLGSFHPITKVQFRIEDFFKSIGFSIAEGPEIEDQFHNFEALNMPEGHPARAMQDTFYFENGYVLRTHTSSVQIRTMEKTKPPIRIIAPGRVYRSDSDQTHTPMFNQIEGLLVDKNVSFADLKSILSQFVNHFFEQKVDIRFRPSFFPFTEPSAEVDIRLNDPLHPLCGRWLEVLGCGMVHPEVLKKVNINTEEYTAWAFGLGMDRLAMLRYGIDDLRLMFENDLRFLSQG